MRLPPPFPSFPIRSIRAPHDSILCDYDVVKVLLNKPRVNVCCTKGHAFVTDWTGGRETVTAGTANVTVSKI